MKRSKAFKIFLILGGAVIAFELFNYLILNPILSYIILDPKMDGGIESIALQADGKILVGGSFKTIAGTTKKYIARLNPDGTLDTTFNPNVNDRIESIVVLPDGKVLIGGYCTIIGDTARSNIARFNPDGTVDATFDPNTALGRGFFTDIAGTINHIVHVDFMEPDGTVHGGDFFTDIVGTVKNHISRIDSIAIQPDGKVLIAGNDVITRGKKIRRKIVRLNPDGTLDPTFNPNLNVNFWVKSMVIQPDGKILVGGYFSIIGRRIRYRIARLNPDGTLDTAFKVGR